MSDTAIDNQVLTDLAELLDRDPACADRVELREIVATQQRVRGWLDSYNVRIARRTRQLAEQDRPSEPVGPKDVIASLLDSGCNSGRDAKSTAVREGVCAELPGFEEALAAGAVSGAHLDAIGQATKNLADVERQELRDRAGELLHHARNEFVETFEKTMRSLIAEIRARHRPDAAADELEAQRKASKVSEWVDRASGMHKFLLELDPVRAGSIRLAVLAELSRLRQDPANGQRPYDELKAQAWVNLVTRSGAADDGGRPVPELIVLIDWGSLREGVLAAGGACETSDGTPLPVSVVRQMAAEANIIPVVLGGQGEVLDVGRARRLATAAQRTALRTMYATCAEPWCDRPFDECRIHHTDEWDHNGLTNLDLLVPLCEQGHQRVHRDGWKVTVTGRHEYLTWTRPDGTTAHHGPGRNRLPRSDPDDPDPDPDR